MGPSGEDGRFGGCRKMGFLGWVGLSLNVRIGHMPSKTLAIEFAAIGKSRMTIDYFSLIQLI